MPYVNVKITRDGVTVAQKKQIVQDITRSLVATLERKKRRLAGEACGPAGSAYCLSHISLDHSGTGLRGHTCASVNSMKKTPNQMPVPMSGRRPAMAHR